MSGPMKRFILDICKGDIGTLRVDACVSTVHWSKNMAVGALASHIYRLCGEEVQRTVSQVNGNQTLNNGQVVTSKPGKKASQFQQLFLVCLYFWQTGYDAVLSACVRECLQNATKNKLTSIAFPALGMGGLSYPPSKVAMAILQTINDFFCEEHTTLEKVYIVLYDPNVSSLQTFLETSIAYLDVAQMIENGTAPKVTLNGKEQNFSRSGMKQIASAFLNSENKRATISYSAQPSDSITSKASDEAEKFLMSLRI